MVERASRFIDDHALEGIGVDDVADAIRVSRRLLDLRFAESGLGSVAGIIRAKKLAEAKRLLKQTSLSDSRIAMRCGFKNVGTLRNLFRKTCGMSMRAKAWRLNSGGSGTSGLSLRCLSTAFLLRTGGLW